MKIYTTVEAVPSRVLAATRYLLSEGEVSSARLLAMLQPRENKEMAEKSVNAAVEFGLIARRPGLYSLQPNLLPPNSKAANLEKFLPATIARLILQPQVNKEPNNFARVCAWMLHQPVIGFPSDRSALKFAVQEKLSLETLQLNSDLRWDNVFYWAKYIGLIRQTKSSPAAGIIPDPTEYLRGILPELLPLGDEIKVKDFRRALGTACPVLDSGTVRSRLLEELNVDWPSHRLSDALSFALRRLEQAKQVQVWCPDDSREFLLTPDDKRIALLKRLR